jgi:imidazolonepropionase-like amidohydrolase
MYRFIAAAAIGALLIGREPSVDQLMVAPPDVERFVVLSAAGEHGYSSLWKGDEGRIFSRESILLRGMVWEQDEVIHFGRNGQPDRITIRGFTPNGDAAETFAISDNEARWKSPVDEGAKAYDRRGHYVTQGGTLSALAVLAEKLYASRSRKLPLLPAGEARLEKLTDLALVEGWSRRMVSAYSIEGLSLGPTPVWMDEHGKFFGFISGLSILPKAYTGDFLRLQKAQDDALAARGPAFVQRFGSLPPTPVAFTHVKLFDAETGRFLEHQTVVVDRGRITSVASDDAVKPLPNSRVIDGSGKTLVPGLWDAHMHIPDDFTGLMLLSLGVTSARNPGAEVEPTIARAERAAKGELLFPRVYSSVLIDGKGPLAAQGGVAVTSAAEAVAGVKMAKEEGFAAVKFYGSIKPEWLPPAIAEAKKAGLHVHGHVPATMRPADVIAAGYDEITHINFVMMQAMPDEVVNQSNGMQRFEGTVRYARNVEVEAEPLKSLIAAMAKKQITVDPTLSAFESIFVPENGDLSPAYAPFTRTMPPASEHQFLTGGFVVPKDLTRADYRASFRKLMELTSALHHAHVSIVAGTDGTGLEIVRELELYVEAGLTPAEALQTATINPARLVNVVDSTGSITVGKKADIVLVDGAHLHARVHRYCNFGRHLHLLPYCLEPHQTERDRVGAGPHIDDRVTSFRVGGCRARSFDQRFAGSIHNDSSHHGAR